MFCGFYGTGGDSTWCCQSGPNLTSCCGDPNNLFREDEMPDGVWGHFFFPEADSKATSVLSSSAMTSTATSDTSQATSSASNASNQPAGATSDHSSLANTVGVAVGVPLGVLTLAVIGFLVWRARRLSHSTRLWSSRMEEQKQPMMIPEGSMGRDYQGRDYQDNHNPEGRALFKQDWTPCELTSSRDAQELSGAPGGR